MNERVKLHVTMELLSDAVFGSGHSIPGGEDIAVVRDDAGYPYIPGTTVKGLLRESMINWIAWTGGDDTVVSEILGESGWEGAADARRLTLTPLTLKGEPPRCRRLLWYTGVYRFGRRRCDQSEDSADRCLCEARPALCGNNDL